MDLRQAHVRTDVGGAGSNVIPTKPNLNLSGTNYETPLNQI